MVAAGPAHHAGGHPFPSPLAFATAGDLAGRGQDAAPRALHAHLDAYFRVAAPRREDFRRAAELVAASSHGLRAGDVPHLAVARAIEAQGLLCLDEAMREAGIPVVGP